MLKKDYRNLAINLLLVIGSVLVGLLILESIIRPHNAKFENFILQDGGDLVSRFYKKLYRYDCNLGWTPRSNVSIAKWRGRASTLDDGIRSNGVRSDIRNDVSILALGDSFTFGDEVPDNKTWPSYLEQSTHSRVYNAGVSSYGLDQIILRLEAEALIKKYNPKVIILSIINDDLQRCLETIRHGVPKPYFILKNDDLILQKQLPFYGQGLDWFRRIFGYSYVCHRIMSSRFPDYWWSGTTRDFRSVQGDALKISELLFDRFMIYAQSKDIILLIECFPWEDKEQRVLSESFIKYVKDHYHKVHVIDLPPLLDRLRETNLKAYKSLFYFHMSPKGNKYVARFLAKEVIRFSDLRLSYTTLKYLNRAPDYLEYGAYN